MANKTFVFNENGQVLFYSKAFNSIEAAVTYINKNTSELDDMVMLTLIIVDFELGIPQFMRVERMITVCPM